MSYLLDDDGFSIPEALIAMFITAIILITAHSLLIGISATGKHVSSFNVQTERIIGFTNQLNRDLLEMQVDTLHPMLSQETLKECLKDIRFFTRNKANPGIILRAPLYRVEWVFNEGEIKRIVKKTSPSTLSSISVYPKIKCLRVSAYFLKQWHELQKIENETVTGITWKGEIDGNLFIEQVIPIGVIRDENNAKKQ